MKPSTATARIISTMETALRMVERKYGKARRIWVMDRGIVSEENLAAIRKRGGQYLVGTPRSQTKRLEAELLKDDWTRGSAGGGSKNGADTGRREETYILCPYRGPQGKREGDPQSFFRQHGKALKALEKTIELGRLKERNKMERRLGKIQARHPSVNDLCEVALRDTSEGVRLFWQIKADPQKWRESRERRLHAAHQSAGGGIGRRVVVRSTCTLTEAEASFQLSKASFPFGLCSIRRSRVKAHVMVAFLGCALWVTPETPARGSRADRAEAIGKRNRVTPIRSRQ